MVKGTSRTIIALAIALAACAACAHAQSDGGFFIESINQESVAPGDVDSLSSGMLGNTLNEYEIDLELPSGLSLYRNFGRTEVTARDLAFDTAISNQTETGATLNLGGRTQMSFTREETAITDVFQQLQEAESTTTMALSQGFGGGASTGQFTLSRSLHSEGQDDGVDLETLTQSFGVETGLGMGMQFSGGFYTRESQESAFRLQESGYNADLRMALSGGEGRAHFNYLTRLAEGRETNRRQLDFVAPFAVEGGTLSAEYHLGETLTGDRRNIDRTTKFAMPLNMVLDGGAFSYLEDVQIRGDKEKVDRETSLVMPLAMLVEGAEASYLEDVEIRGDKEKTDREMKVVMPLDMVIDGAQASYLEITKIRDENHNEQRILNFMTPFRMFGRDATFEHTQTETIKNEQVQDERVMRLTANFDGSNAMVEHTATVQPRGEDLEHRARLRMQTPRIDLTEWASFTANQVRNEVEGDETSRVSRVDLSVEPFDPLEVHAIYTRHEAPGEDTRADHDIKTALSLSQSAMLKGGILERSARDGSPSIIRELELTKQAGDTGLDMRLGYTSFGAQYEDPGGDMLAQLNWDAGSDIGLSAFYTEFDAKKKKPLDSPTTTLELRAGSPERLGFRAGYSSHAGRVEPERTLGLATGTLGGALRFDYIRNPLDPRGKSVMLSDVYEMSFKRQVMGSVSMDVGYRYFVPREGEVLDDDHFYRLQLDGGSVNDGGQIALKYLSGHFVPYPKRGDPPASILDLSYEKRWPEDAGRLTLSLAREEAPALSVGVDDSFEAEVKYETLF